MDVVEVFSPARNIYTSCKDSWAKEMPNENCNGEDGF